MPESAHAKAGRLLVGGAVNISRVDDLNVEAIVHGDTATHEVHYADGRWACSCSSLGVCSHALSVARVTVVTDEEPREVFVA